MYPSSQLTGKYSQRFFMGTQIIHDQMNRPLTPKHEHLFFPELLTRDSIFLTAPLSHRPSTCWTESAEPLQRSIASITVRSSSGPFPPSLSPSRNGLKRPQFIETHHHPSLRRMPIKLYNGVFFTLKSGSSLSHQVWPVKKRRPCRPNTRRIVSRLMNFKEARFRRCASNLANDQVVNPSPKSCGREVAA